MSDALFILTVVYACYVIYSVTAEEDTPKKIKVTADKAFKPLVDVPARKKEVSAPVTEEKIAEVISPKVDVIPPKSEKKSLNT